MPGQSTSYCRYHYACVDITPENAPDTFVCAGCQATESSPQAVVAAVKKIVVKPLKITRTAQLRKMAQQGFAETFEAIFARIASNPQEIVVDPSHHLDVNAFAQQMERALFEAYSDSEECNDQVLKYRIFRTTRCLKTPNHRFLHSFKTSAINFSIKSSTGHCNSISRTIQIWDCVENC